jgi:type VI secretion system secreted protein Hcp
LLAAALAASAAVPAPAVAAVSDIFLKFVPAIQGDATEKNHAGQIQLRTFSVGVSNTGTPLGGGGGAGKPVCEALGATKGIDQATPPLWRAAFTGQHYQSAQIDVQRAGTGNDKTATVFLKYEMSDVVVASTENAGTINDLGEETIALRWSKIKVTYSALNAKGVPVSNSVTLDCATNKTSVDLPVPE